MHSRYIMFGVFSMGPNFMMQEEFRILISGSGSELDAQFHGDRQRDNDEVSPKHIADIVLS